MKTFSQYSNFEFGVFISTTFEIFTFFKFYLYNKVKKQTNLFW